MNMQAEMNNMDVPKFVSGLDPEDIEGGPNESRVLLSGGTSQNQGFKIRHVELRLYRKRHDKRLGYYSLITALVETDRGSIELKYDEGFRGEDALTSTSRMLAEYVGLASLINRALIELQGYLP
jgi:hypothetical protein